MNILALNGGSATIKAAWFKRVDGVLQRINSWNVGRAEGIDNLASAVTETPELVVHRIVHGADHFAAATVLDDDVMLALRKLEPLAPLHQPFNLDLVEEARSKWPQAQHVGCFDTAFHQTQSDLQRRYALPREWHDRGIKRYGFHGLSYSFVSEALFKREPALREARIVIAHLGSGASACAVQCGVSVATSMGFSPLEGLVMGTRCGQLDPGVILHFLREGMDVAALEKILYKQSGLLGVSGISADLRELLLRDELPAEQAVELFVRRCCEVIAGLVADMQGIDALVFTGGIGEHQAETRAYIVQRLAWLGAVLDNRANAEHSWCISEQNSRLRVFVVQTDEEREMVQQSLERK
jgi:acetate kinase